MFHLTYILYVLIIYDSSFSVGKEGAKVGYTDCFYLSNYVIFCYNIYFCY